MFITVFLFCSFVCFVMFFFVYFAYLNICYIVCLFPFSFLSFLFRFHVVQPIPSWVRYQLNVF